MKQNMANLLQLILKTYKTIGIDSNHIKLMEKEIKDIILAQKLKNILI